MLLYFLFETRPNVIQTGFQMLKFLILATVLSHEPHFQDTWIAIHIYLNKYGFIFSVWQNGFIWYDSILSI